MTADLKRRYLYMFWVAALLLAGATPSLADVRQLNALESHRVIQANQGNADFVILDIRTPKEFAYLRIQGAVLLDYNGPGFVEGLKRLDKSKSYLVYCHSGSRSSRALRLFERMGFRRIYHLQRGLIDWYRHKLPLVKS